MNRLPDSVEYHPAGYRWTDAMAQVDVLDRFEGGAIYAAMSTEALWVVVDEGTLADFLPVDDPTRGELIRLERYEDRKEWEAAVAARKQAAQERFIRNDLFTVWPSYEKARADWQESFLTRIKRRRPE